MDSWGSASGLASQVLARLKQVRLGLLIPLASMALFLIVATLVVIVVHVQARQQVLEEATARARLLLDHNLAIHTFYSHDLRPALSEWSAPFRDPDEYELLWMSSSYAVQQIQDYFASLSGLPYHYKEAAIDARNPANEADALEREVLRRFEEDQALTTWSEVVRIVGEPTLVTYRRGEVVEEGCMRCHGASGEAPQQLVAAYGAERGFDREVGDLASVISIQVPLGPAYRIATQRSLRLVLWLLPLLVGSQGLVLWASQRLLFDPLKAMRLAALRVANGEVAGRTTADGPTDRIPPVAGQELRALATAFNRMSANLREERALLETRVAERTTALDALNADLQLEVTGRRRVEQALRQSEMHYRGLFEHSLSGILLLRLMRTAQGRPVDFAVVGLNGVGESLLGIGRDRAVGRLLSEVLPDVEPDLLRLLARTALSARPTQTDYVHPSTSRHYAMSIFSPTRDRLAVVFDDITDRERAERELAAYSERLETMVAARTQALQEAQEQLFRREKLALLGQMAGGVSHELRNPLAIIANSTYLLTATLTDVDPQVRETLDQIIGQVGKAEKIIRDLLDFTRTGRAERLPTAPATLVAQAIADAEPPPAVDVRTKLPPRLPLLLVDPQQLTQVLSNLLTNAYQAMSAGGTVTVHSFQREAEVGLAVSDTGSGISPDHLERLFEPLFTTKSRGIGLGLTVCKNLVELNGGRIEIKSQLGEGSTFTVWLPVAD